MSFVLSAIQRAGLAVGKPAGKMAIGGAFGRIALGGAIGGVYGAATTENRDPTNFMGAMARGAFAGALMGGASRMVTPAIKFGAGGRINVNSPYLSKIVNKPMLATLARGTMGVGKRAGSAAYNVGGWIRRNPYKTAGIAVGGVLANMGNNTFDESPTLENYNVQTSMTREAAALENMNAGVSPMGGMTGSTTIRNQQLMASTYGLVQGLHRSRH